MRLVELAASHSNQMDVVPVLAITSSYEYNTALIRGILIRGTLMYRYGAINY